MGPMIKFRHNTLSRFARPVPVFSFLSLAWAVMLGGCSLYDDFINREKEPPLPGDRISVLLHQRSLSPDPKLANVQILLPAPEPNADWPQAGGFPNHAMHHMQAPDSINQAWSVDIGDGSDDEERLAASPVIAGGRNISP